MTAKDLASGKIKGVGDQAKTSMDKLRGMRGQFLAVGAAGAAVVGALGLAIKSFAQTGDEIQKMSMRTALTTEVLSEYKFALEQSGSSIEGFEKSIRRMSSFILDGRDGLTTTTDALDTLGVSVKDLEGLGVEDAFVFLSSALADVEDDITQAALAQDLFGRSGTALLPLLAQGADGIAALREEAQDLGIVFDQDMADSAARVIDAQNTMRKSTLGLQMAFAEHLAPALSGTLETIGKVISSVTSFAKENPVLTQTLGILAATVGTLAIGIAAIGIALPIAATMMAGLGTATAGTALAFVGFNLATGGILLAIGAVIAGIVLLIQNWDEVVRAIKIGINFMIVAAELWVNTYISAINKIIDGVNLLAGVFGKEINQIAEVEIPRLNTAVEETAKVVDESSDGIGTALSGLQNDFTETADVAEDAYKRMAQAAQDAHSKQVDEAIEASKGLSELFQRKRERDEKIALWDEQQAQESMDRAMEEAKVIVAASDKRYDDIRANRERDLAHDLNIAASRADAAEALEQENKEAFEALRQSVNMLPSVMPSSLGIGANMSDPGVAVAARVLKSKGAGARSVGGGKFETTGVTGERVVVNMNVYGNMFGQDTEDLVNESVKQGAQRGMWDMINEG